MYQMKKVVLAVRLVLLGDGRPTRAVFYSILVLLVLENDAGGVDRLHPAPSGAKKAQRCRQMFRNGLEVVDKTTKG